MEKKQKVFLFLIVLLMVVLSFLAGYYSHVQITKKIIAERNVFEYRLCSITNMAINLSNICNAAYENVTGIEMGDEMDLLRCEVLK
jgi:hypothetical protein